MDCAIIASNEEWCEKTLELAPKLAALLPKRGAAEWWLWLQEGRKNNKRYLSIAKKITASQKDSLSLLPIFNMRQFEGGAIYELCEIRRYPFDNLAKRTIGHSLPYMNGRVGIEGKFDDSLNEGFDVHLSLSMPLQAVADSSLRAVLAEEKSLESGCLIVMEVSTGAICAMVNLSKGMREPVDSVPWEQYNLAIGRAYEPGEVIRSMTLASVLRDGYLHSLAELELATDKDYSNLATTYYSGCPKYYTEGIRAMCLPKQMSFDIVGFQPVDITSPDGYYWTETSLSRIANGYALTMTPLDILSFYNTIANGGTMVIPYLVESISQGKDVYYRHYSELMKKRILSPVVAGALVNYLRTTSDNQIAGQTGSALQILSPIIEGAMEEDPYHNKEGQQKTAFTFAGFFPIDKPRYSVVCVLQSYPSNNQIPMGALTTTVIKDLLIGLDNCNYKN